MTLNPIAYWTQTESGRNEAAKIVDDATVRSLIRDCLLRYAMLVAGKPGGDMYIKGACDFVQMMLTITEPKESPKPPTMGLPYEEGHSNT